MADSHQPEDVATYNESSLKALVRAIRLSHGQFRLILVRCNYAALRERLVQRLRELSPVKIREIVLPESVKLLYTAIKAELGDEVPQALMVFGFELVSDLNTLIISSNYIREEFRKNFPFPLVMWINDEVLRTFIRLAPDSESSATKIEFAIATDELIEFLQQEAESLFTKVLDAGADRFVDNAALNLATGASQCFELELALKELQRRGCHEPVLEASQQFILGRDAYANDQMERALQLYQQSLNFWQQNQDLERRACLLFHLGLWWRKYAVLHQAEHKTACGRAGEYYQQCVEVLQQANRLDLVAKFINSWTEVLQQLEQWDELETVAKESVKLHQIYPDPFNLANAYGYLGEVALAKSAGSDTKRYAEIALQTIAQQSESDGIRNRNTDLGWIKHHQSWYRLLLAKGQQNLGQLTLALQSLEKAEAECKPQYYPPLYVRILEALRSLYFEQHRYLDAFNRKQDRLRIERQYGFQAFIGAGRLTPQQKVINPALGSGESAQLCEEKVPTFDNQATIAPEIVAAGRKQDVDSLIKRLTRNDQKLIVIHGPSGVGKSSLLTAGLVPVLHELAAIDSRNFLPVVVRTYTDWVRELRTALEKALGEVKVNHLSAVPDSVESIIEQLQKNVERNLLTVIIFDQFEEFFFNCPKLAERRIFWEFLHLCLDRIELPYVKVILSLREDYLHYLLECDRLTNLEITKNDILNKEIRYPFGNFAPEQAKHVIQRLTQHSFYLEPELIDELVRELAGELGEVRPIELQVVGAQLQEEKISTLAQYQQSGLKEKLVERFIEDVVKDCGSESERAAWLALYWLTDDNNTRPPKTHTELAANLAEEADKLDLVLNIFVKSGLVFVISQSPADRYQLIHDYLVSLIRQQRGAEFIAELEREKEKRKLAEAQQKLAEAKLNQFLKRQLKAASAAGFLLAILAASAVGFALRAESQRKVALNALLTFSETLFDSGKDFEALIASLTAGVQLKQAFGAKADSETPVVATLRKAVYEVQERNRLEGHSRGIWSVSFSPDGQTLASASDDQTIKLWSREGKLINTLKGHSAEIWSVSFSPDGQTLASASLDKTIKLWSCEGKLLNTLKHSDQVMSVSFSPDGKTLASASRDKTVKLWSRDGQLLKTLIGHNAPVMSVSFSPDGKMIASASNDKTIKLWSREGELIKTLPGHNLEVNSVSFSPDGKTLASASNDKTIKLWSRDGKLIKTLTEHSDQVRNVSFSPDGKMIASASKDNTIKLWSRDGKLLNTLYGHSNYVTSISFSPDSQTLASGSWDNTIKLWKNCNEKRLHTLKGDAQVNSVSFSPDGKTLASARWDNTINIWSRDGDLLKTLTGHKFGVMSISFSPDGQMLASASYDNTIKLWSRDGKLLNTLQHSNRVTSVSFSPDGQTLASASWDNTIKLWSRDGKLLKTLPGHNLGVNSVSFSPDGQTLASASDDTTIKLWSRDGKLLKTLPGHNLGVNSVSFSPDGQTLASASNDKTIRLWSLDGKLLKTLSGHNLEVNSVSFSPDGKTLASASKDKTIKLWSRDGKLLNTLEGHRTSINSVSFSPDGQTLASGSWDMTILWDLKHIENLDELVVYGCDWVRDYLKTNPNVRESDRHLCDGIGTQK